MCHCRCARFVYLPPLQRLVLSLFVRCYANAATPQLSPRLQAVPHGGDHNQEEPCADGEALHGVFLQASPFGRVGAVKDV